MGRRIPFRSEGLWSTSYPPVASDARAERVTHAGVSRLEPGPKPLRSLPGRPVGPGFRIHPLARRTLDAIVPHGRRGVERLFQVTRLQQVLVVGTVAPYAGIAVGLQLQPDGQLVRLAEVPFLLSAHALLRSQEVLDVVAELVRDHVRLREVPGCAEAAPE